MAKILHKGNPSSKRRAYFTCHPEDFEKYFDKICEDIFKKHDCVIFYKEDMSELIAAQDKETQLAHNNLLVVPVTLKLLTTPNPAMDDEIRYARQEGMPILPLMMEPGLAPIYSLPDKFGKLQYLSPFDKDDTAITYAEKLKKFLDTKLISDETVKRIQAAFDAYIFLSYRKKDRRYANELMKLIHSHPQCRDIAIWYDEFLIPGESFTDNIEKMLARCDLFTLLVTPQLFKPGTRSDGTKGENFVLSTELPMAKEKKAKTGMPILAVEMEKTDKDQVDSLRLNNCLCAEDAAFFAGLAEEICKLATKANDTPEHNFLIGLAYMEGIDMEVDRARGLEMITAAAEADLPEAMKMLFGMYREGDGVRLDYEKAAFWAERLANYYRREYGEENPDTLHSLNDLAVMHLTLGDYEKALALQEKVYAGFCTRFGEQDDSTLEALHNLAAICGAAGQHQKALKLGEKAYALRCGLSGEKDPKTLTVLNSFACTCSELGDYEKAMEQHEKVYALRCETSGEEHPVTLMSLNNLAMAYYDLGDYTKALELNEKAYTLRCKVLGDEHPDTLMSLLNVASAHSALGAYQKALEQHEKAYALHCRVLGKEHPATLTALNNLAAAYGDLGDYEKALERKDEAYTLRCKVLGAEHPATLISLSNLAVAYSDLGDYAKALELDNKAYTLRCKVLGEEHPATLMSLHNMGSSYCELGDYAKALDRYEKAYNLQCKVLDEEHPDALASLHDTAYAYGALGNHEKALELQEKAYALRCKVLGEEHADTLDTLHTLALTHSSCDNYQKALEPFKKVYTLRCRNLGEEHPDTLIAQFNLAWTCYKLEDYRKAQEMAEKVYHLRCKVSGKDHSDTVQVRKVLQVIYMTRGVCRHCGGKFKQLGIMRCGKCGRRKDY